MYSYSFLLEAKSLVCAGNAGECNIKLSLIFPRDFDGIKFPLVHQSNSDVVVSKIASTERSYNEKKTSTSSTITIIFRHPLIFSVAGTKPTQPIPIPIPPMYDAEKLQYTVNSRRQRRGGAGYVLRFAIKNSEISVRSVVDEGRDNYGINFAQIIGSGRVIVELKNNGSFRGTMRL